MKTQDAWVIAVATTLILFSQQAMGQIARGTGLLAHHHFTGSVLLVRSVRLSIKPEHRVNFLQATTALAAAARQEAGCVSYRCYEDLEEPNTFYQVGEWTNEMSMRAHLRLASNQVYSAELPGWLVAPATITVQEVGNRRTTTQMFRKPG